MTILTIFFQMLALLLMILAGWYVTKTGMMDGHTNSQMSNMIVRVFNPMLIVANAVNAVGQISLRTMGLVGIIAVFMFLVFILSGMVLSPFFHEEGQQRKMYQMMFVFSNLGFIGIPVVSGILGPAYVIYVTEFMLVYNFVFYTYGISLMEGSFTFSSLKGMINPGTIFSIVAMLVIILEIQVPGFIKTTVTYLGNVTSPMALIAVGFTLANSSLKSIFGQPRLYILAAVKLLIIPLALLPLLRMVTADVSLIQVCMIMFGMPIGNMPLILATQKGIDSSTCSAAIILTTILCVFTVPVLLAISLAVVV